MGKNFSLTFLFAFVYDETFSFKRRRFGLGIEIKIHFDYWRSLKVFTPLYFSSTQNRGELSSEEVSLSRRMKDDFLIFTVYDFLSASNHSAWTAILVQPPPTQCRPGRLSPSLANLRIFHLIGFLIIRSERWWWRWWHCWCACEGSSSNRFPCHSLLAAMETRKNISSHLSDLIMGIIMFVLLSIPSRARWPPNKAKKSIEKFLEQKHHRFLVIITNSLSGTLHILGMKFNLFRRSFNVRPESVKQKTH